MYSAAVQRLPGRCYLEILGAVSDDAKDGRNCELGQHVPLRKRCSRQLKVGREVCWDEERVRIVPTKMCLFTRAVLNICTENNHDVDRGFLTKMCREI